jgi:hypothetical protein
MPDSIQPKGLNSDHCIALWMREFRTSITSKNHGHDKFFPPAFHWTKPSCWLRITKLRTSRANEPRNPCVAWQWNSPPAGVTACELWWTWPTRELCLVLPEQGSLFFCFFHWFISYEPTTRERGLDSITATPTSCHSCNRGDQACCEEQRRFTNSEESKNMLRKKRNNAGYLNSRITHQSPPDFSVRQPSLQHQSCPSADWTKLPPMASSEYLLADFGYWHGPSWYS